jgi:glutamyl-tRNA reductase
MILQVIGCSHHNTSIAVRERLAFTLEQSCAALEKFRLEFPQVEALLLSTCNRTELYTAADGAAMPAREALAEFLADFHTLNSKEILEHLYQHADREAVSHLFSVASSLDSMVVGEPQILSQVKQAYLTATELGTAGPLTHATFQAALRVARRVAGETAIHQRRVSIPSVAVVDFAQQIFERFDDKKVLVIGAGEMAEETLRYLQDEGAHDVTVVNRSPDRATELAQAWRGRDPRNRSSPWPNSARSRPPATSAPCSSSIWPCRAISTRPSATGRRFISIRSTTCVRPANATAASATGSCPRRPGSSSTRRPVSWPSCTIGRRAL